MKQIRFVSIVSVILVLWNSPHLAAQWSQTGGPTGILYYCLAANANTLFAGSMGNGIYRSTDNGTTWQPIDSGLTNLGVITLAAAGTNVLAGTGSGIFRSTDNGTSWKAANSGLANMSVIVLLMRSGGNGDTVFAGTNGGGVFASTNGGASWSASSSGLTNMSIHSLAIGGTNVYAGTEAGIFHSTNSGGTWTCTPSAQTYTNVPALTVSGTDVFVAAWGKGVLRSGDSTSSFTEVNSGLSNKSERALISIGSTIFVGADTGHVYRSTNRGASWTDINAGLGAIDIYAMTSNGSSLFLATRGGGIWIRPLSEIISDVPVNSKQLPAAFHLGQNYPNPFNPTTNIEFQLPNAGMVRLVVFDLLGREVAVLVNEVRSPGIYTARWDATGMSSGMYFYQLTVGTLTETKKLLLLK